MAPRLMTRGRSLLVTTAVALGLALLVLALHHPLVAVRGEPAALVQWDSRQFSYPYLAFINRCFRAGLLPHWNPFSFAGTPFLGNLQSMMFNPPTVLFTLFTELTVERFQLLLLVQLFIGALGMYLWGHARTDSRPAALLGALAFAGCGLVVDFFSHYLLLSLLCLLPYPFVAFEGWRRHRRWPWLLLGTLSVAAWLTTSYPSACGYYCVAFALYFLTRRPAWRWLVVETLAFAVLPALIAAIHLLPAFALLPLMTRGGGLPLTAAFNGSLHPVQVASLLLPALAGAPSDFTTPDITLRNLGIGMVPCLLALVALTKPDRGRLLRLGAAIVCLELMLGPSSHLLPLLHRISYLSANSGYPIVDFAGLLTFVLLTLAMEGCADLLRGGVGPRRWLSALAGVLLCWAAFHAFGTTHYAAARTNPHWLTFTVWTPALSLTIFVVAVLAGGKRRALLAAGLVLACYVDVAGNLDANRPVLYKPAPPEYFTQQASAYRAATARYFDFAHNWPRLRVYPRPDSQNLIDGHFSDGGYDSTVLHLHERAMADEQTHRQLLDVQPAEGEAHVEVARYLPDAIRYRVSVATTTTVVFHELAAPGWRLTVDGEARASESRGPLRAATLSPGDHDVLFRYRAPGARAGLVLTLLGFLGLAALCVWLSRPRRVLKVWTSNHSRH